MTFATIDYLAVLAATVAAFVFGAVYYMSLAKHWLAATGKTEAQAKAERSPLPFIVSLLAEFVMAYLLASMIGGASLMAALKAAGLLWLAFVATTLTVNNAYRAAPYKLSLIDAGHWLGVLLLQALVLTLV